MDIEEEIYYNQDNGKMIVQDFESKDRGDQDKKKKRKTEGYGVDSDTDDDDDGKITKKGS